MQRFNIFVPGKGMVYLKERLGASIDVLSGFGLLYCSKRLYPQLHVSHKNLRNEKLGVCPFSKSNTQQCFHIKKLTYRKNKIQLLDIFRT